MSKRGWLLFVAMCVVWGVPYLLIKVAVRVISPAELVFARTAIGAILLLPIAARRGQLRPLLPRWRPLLAYSLVEIALPWFLLSNAEERISSSLSGLLVAAVPLVGTVIFFLRGKRDRSSRGRTLGLAVGILGVGAVLGFDTGHLTLLTGVQMAVVVVCYALGPQILASQLSDLPGLGVVSSSLALCALIYLPVVLVQHPDRHLTPQVVASVVGLAVVCTAFAFVLFFHLISEVGAVRATVITYVNPAVAVILGVVLLHERLTAGALAGFLLILAGSVLATRPNRDRGRGAQPEPEEISVVVAEP